MDFRLLLRQVAVKHGAEDGASHGEHVLRKHKILLLAPSNEETGTMLRLETQHVNTGSTGGGGGITLCAGTLCEAPRGPTMKWTSAISSLLNIKAFLKEETHNEPLCPPVYLLLPQIILRLSVHTLQNNSDNLSL